MNKARAIKDILAEATRHPIFVHRFKYSHDTRRKLTRRLCKDGLLTMTEHRFDGFVYIASQQPADKEGGST